jgi:hypothetical protein
VATETLLKRVKSLLAEIEKSDSDPLALMLAKEYKELQALEERVETRLDIDEMLNEVLEVKVTKVQELARLLTSPEMYVSKLKSLDARSLARLMLYNRPLILEKIHVRDLMESLDRVSQHIDALHRELPEEKIPSITKVPDDYEFESEDAVFLEDLRKFAKSIKKGKSISLDDLVTADEFEESLLRFLYTVILISKGVLQYNPEKREIERIEEKIRF